MARSNQKKKRRDKVAGRLLGAIGIVLMMLIGGGVWWVRSTKVHLDAATNCPQSGPRAVEVIMIDRSDPISEQQAQRIRQEVQRLKDLAQFGTRFDLYNFEGNQTNALLPEAQVCAPAKPTDANVVVENPERVRRIYVDKFSRPLDVAIDQLLVATTKPVSPIFGELARCRSNFVRRVARWNTLSPYPDFGSDPAQCCFIPFQERAGLRDTQSVSCMALAEAEIARCKRAGALFVATLGDAERPAHSNARAPSTLGASY